MRPFFGIRRKYVCSLLGCWEGLAFSLLVSERSLLASAQFLPQGSLLSHFASASLYCKVCGAARVTFTLLGPVCSQVDVPYYNFCVLPSVPCIMALSLREREAIP